MMDTKTKAGIAVVEQPCVADSNLKQTMSCSATVAAKTMAETEDAALMQEEERMLEADEEITSEEEGTEEMERKLVTVALVKSVVETSGHLNRTAKPQKGGSGPTASSVSVSPRYGLRKRRRSAGDPFQRPTEMVGASSKSADRKGSPGPVPNPLAGSPTHPPSPTVSSASPTHVVPCPLPAAALPPSPPQKRADAAPPERSETASSDKRKVTISETTRTRGFSIDLDSVGLDSFQEDGANPEGGGRERAFSFECFAFGINADEPLPPLQDSSDSFGFGRPRGDSFIILDGLLQDTASGRPRGDSIIFDPSSFQDGGIHEQNALCKAVGPSSDAANHAEAPRPEAAISCPQPIKSKAPPAASAAAAPPSSSSRRPASAKPVPPTTLSSSPPTLPAVTSYTATTTTDSHTKTTVTITASPNSASVSMDLLNKDGRIGIYLPEARKARIARFHAKRERRIWRKRIKYDCRKKLADSRPRIKGRFVKRSDMEED